jgi:hypothetical protein
MDRSARYASSGGRVLAGLYSISGNEVRGAVRLTRLDAFRRTDVKDNLLRVYHNVS